MSIVTYENVDTPVFELDTMRYLFRDGLQGMWIDFLPDYAFADTDLTTPANPGEGIAGYVDRGPYGYDGTQSVITARPIFGRVPRTGRRNLLTYTEDLSSNQWYTIGSAVKIGSDRIEGDPSGVARIGNIAPVGGPTTTPPGTKITASYDVYPDAGLDGASIRLRYDNEAFLPGIPSTVEFFFDGRPAPEGGTMTPLNGGGWRLEFTGVTSAPLTRPARFYFGLVGPLTPGLGARVTRFQTIIGDPAPYQRVGNEYDITEAGVPSVYYAHYDGADDVLPSSLTIPSISEGCFILVGTAGIWIDNEWVNTSGSLSVGPNTYTGGPAGILPVVGNILSIIWREEPLTEAEKAEVVRYGVKRGSPGEIE